MIDPVCIIPLIILSVSALYFVLSNIRARKIKNLKIITGITIFIFILFISSSLNNIFSIIIPIIMVLFICGGVAYYEYLTKIKEEILYYSDTFAKKHNIRYTYNIPTNIIKEHFGNIGEFSPYNNKSSFYLYSFFNRLPYSIGNDSTISFEFDKLRLYLIDRKLTYRTSGRGGVTYSSVEETLFIIESIESVDIPYFILRDRIPIVDKIRSLFTINNTHYINFSFDSIFSKNYIVEGNNDRLINNFFDERIRSVAIYNKIKDVTFLSKGNKLLVRVAHYTKDYEREAVLKIAFSIFKIENYDDLNFKSEFIKPIAKKVSIRDYLVKKTPSGGSIEIPPLFGAFIFILSAIILVIVFYFVF